MDYHELEPEVRRYMRRSTFQGMSQDEQEVYIKGIRRIIRKLSEMNDRKSYLEVAGKLHISQPPLGFMAVGMRFRGSHNFSEDDNITLELDDDNPIDKYAIKILVDDKHVAFVAAGDNRKLRNIDGLLDRPIHIVKKYAHSVKMVLGELPIKHQKKQHKHEVVPKISGMYTKGHVLSNGTVIPLVLTDKIVLEPTMDDFLIRQLSKYGDEQLIATYESDYEYHIPF